MDLAPARQLPDAEWLRSAAPKRVIEALAAAGYTGRAVGGCVRDALLDRPIGDIDLATDARPEDVTTILAEAGLKVIPTGIEHGTVTAVADGQAVEVTTLRADVETYGRHAKVAFTGDWQADAARRDFTVNALYADLTGAVYDPVGGLPDLDAGRIRFIGDAETRIAEDALRILRFFRFYAWFGQPPPDRQAMAACRARRGDLGILSAERISTELLKLLKAPDPMPAITAMADSGATAELFPAPTHPEALARLVATERALDRPDPIRRLVVWLSGDTALLARRADQLRLSGKDKARLVSLAEPRPPVDLAGDDALLRRELYHHGRQKLVDLLILALADAGARAPDPPEQNGLLEKAETLPIPQLPVTGKDVLSLGVPAGRRVGDILKQFETWWLENDFPEETDRVQETLRELARAESR